MDGYKAILVRYFSLWVYEYDIFYKLVEKSGFISTFESKRPLDITIYMEAILVANSRQIVKIQTLLTDMVAQFGYSRVASNYLKERYKSNVRAYHRFFNQSLIMKIENKSQPNSFINQHKINLLSLLSDQQELIKNLLKDI